MVHVVDLLHVVVFFPGDAVKAHLAHHLERGLEACQGFHGSVAAHVLVPVQYDHAVLISNRHDGFGEITLFPGVGGFLLGLHRKAIDIFTSEAFQSSDQVGADTLRHETCMQVGFRVGRPGASIGTHGYARHRLYTTGNHHVFPPGAHFHGGQVHGFQAGGAEAVQGHAGDLLIPISGQCRRLGDIRALVTHGGDAAHDDIIYLRSVEPVTLFQSLEHGSEQRDRLNAVQ